MRIQAHTISVLATVTVLGTGTAAIAAILMVGVWAAWHTRGEGYARRRRAMLWAFLATSSSLGIATLCAAEGARYSIAVCLAPMLTWLLSTLLLPLWRDDDSMVDVSPPETGWKRLFGMRVVYSNRENPAVWVRLLTRYTPNLGHFWGRMTVAMFFASLLSSMAVSVAASWR